MTDPSSGAPDPHPPSGPPAPGWPPAGPLPPAGPQPTGPHPGPAGGNPPPQGGHPITPGHPPYPPQPGPVPPQAGPYQPQARPYQPQAGPYPPHAAPLPPGPYPPPPRAPQRSRGGRVVAVVLSLVVLLVLSCCGAFTYSGWWQPRERMEQRRQMHADIGVPAGFTRQDVSESLDNEVLSATYMLTCEKGACPVNLAESVQSWLADAGAEGVTIRDVADCIDDHLKWGGLACDGWTWERDGFEVKADIANVLPKYVGPGRTDKEVIVSLSIGHQD